VRESPGTAAIDAERRLGVIVGLKAMRLAVAKARPVGVGVVTVDNSGHFGAIGHYAMQAAAEDMVGVCFTGAGLSVVPTFAPKPMLGTNPIALAAPARHEAPMLFDAATSAIAGNKIRRRTRTNWWISRSTPSGAASRSFGRSPGVWIGHSSGSGSSGTGRRSASWCPSISCRPARP
jgi:LDH2 family malate/lactate/ureidoglycolate dehydrogenase